MWITANDNITAMCMKYRLVVNFGLTHIIYLYRVR
jgi:hypothetical protein